MQNEGRSIASESDSRYRKAVGGLKSATPLSFMEIRFRSLGKALDELRTQRVQLDEDLRRGHIDQSEYASRLLSVIVETNQLNKEREEVELRVKAIHATNSR